MNKIPIDFNCSICGVGNLVAKASPAAHDPGLIDFIVECEKEEGGCGLVLNEFIAIANMTEVPQ